MGSLCLSTFEALVQKEPTAERLTLLNFGQRLSALGFEPVAFQEVISTPTGRPLIEIDLRLKLEDGSFWVIELKEAFHEKNSHRGQFSRLRDLTVSPPLSAPSPISRITVISQRSVGTGRLRDFEKSFSPIEFFTEVDFWTSHPFLIAKPPSPPE